MEEAYSQLVEFVKELENDPDDDAPAATEPSNGEPIPSKAVEVVMQATNKVVKSLCMFNEFEMVLQDKIGTRPNGVVLFRLVANVLGLVFQLPCISSRTS